MNKVESLEESELLIKGVTDTFKYKEKEWKGRFISMLLHISGATFLRNISAGKKAIATAGGRGTKKAREGIIRAVHGF